jgi:hypothetical protein
VSVTIAAKPAYTLDQVSGSAENSAPDHGGKGLHADGSVDPLAEQVCVAVVAGVLLDHVDEDPRSETVQRHVSWPSMLWVAAMNASALQTVRTYC